MSSIGGGDDDDDAVQKLNSLQFTVLTDVVVMYIHIYIAGEERMT